MGLSSSIFRIFQVNNQYGYTNIGLGKRSRFIYMVDRDGCLGAERFLNVETEVIINTLFLVAAIILIGLSGGILYLTALEWRDRRQQEKDRKLK